MGRNNQFDSMFDQLLSVWSRHEAMRSSASFGELMDSRRELDTLRYEVWVAAHRAA